MSDDIAYIEHAQDVLAKAVDLATKGERFALVTSVDIKGGTARELGSLALVAASGQMVGYLSNGCIDQDIRLNALASLDQGQRQIIHYGEGSPFPDLTLPCGGMLKVLLDPAPDLRKLRAAYKDLKARRPAQLSFSTPSNAPLLTVQYMPKPKVTFAGRGAVFRAAVILAHASGFEVTGLSPDEHDLEAVAMAGAARVSHLASPQAASRLDLDPWSAFLTLFHDHSWEPDLLMAATRTPCRFIGALGSRRTHDARRQMLLSMGGTQREVDRIKGPVGLVSSLRSADLIAASVIAELAAAFSRSQTVMKEPAVTAH
ncbi:MAG: XdhC family protein [Pseudomonadota bacterium]